MINLDPLTMPGAIGDFSAVRSLLSLDSASEVMLGVPAAPSDSQFQVWFTPLSSATNSVGAVKGPSLTGSQFVKVSVLGPYVIAERIAGTVAPLTPTLRLTGDAGSAAASSPGARGDGSDGALVVGPGVTFTMDRVYYWTSVTIEETGTLDARNPIFATGIITNLGRIKIDGSAGAADGTPGSGGYVYGLPPTTGSNGGTGQAGSGGAAEPYRFVLGGSGGAGGEGASVSEGRGTGSGHTAEPPRDATTAAAIMSSVFSTMVSPPTVSPLICGGGGGGGGGGNGVATAGGGGGGGGGLGLMSASAVVNLGEITALGGAGATPMGGAAGGGGGGGGGNWTIIAATYDGDLPDVSGGAGGSGVGGGANATAGSAGEAILLIG